MTMISHLRYVCLLIVIVLVWLIVIVNSLPGVFLFGSYGIFLRSSMESLCRC